MIETLLNIGCGAIAYIFALVGLFMVVAGIFRVLRPDTARIPHPEGEVAILWLIGGSFLYAAWRFITL